MEASARGNMYRPRNLRKRPLRPERCQAASTSHLGTTSVELVKRWMNRWLEHSHNVWRCWSPLLDLSACSCLVRHLSLDSPSNPPLPHQNRPCGLSIILTKSSTLTFPASPKLLGLGFFGSTLFSRLSLVFSNRQTASRLQTSSFLVIYWTERQARQTNFQMPPLSRREIMLRRS